MDNLLLFLGHQYDVLISLNCLLLLLFTLLTYLQSRENGQEIVSEETDDDSAIVDVSSGHNQTTQTPQASTQIPQASPQTPKTINLTPIINIHLPEVTRMGATFLLIQAISFVQISFESVFFLKTIKMFLATVMIFQLIEFGRKSINLQRRWYIDWRLYLIPVLIIVADLLINSTEDLMLLLYLSILTGTTMATIAVVNVVEKNKRTIGRPLVFTAVSWFLIVVLFSFFTLPLYVVDCFNNLQELSTLWRRFIAFIHDLGPLIISMVDFLLLIILGSSIFISKYIEEEKYHIRMVSFYRRQRLSLSLILLIVLVIGVVATNYVGNKMDQRKRKELLTLGQVSITNVQVHDLQSLAGNKNDLQLESFQRLKNAAQKIKQADSSIRFAYFVRKTKDHEVIFLVDAEDASSEDYSPPGQVFIEANSELKQVFEHGGAIIQGPVKDRWGNWISALIPIIDPDGKKVVALFGLDISYHDWQHAIRASRMSSILLFIMFMMIISFFFIIYFRAERDRLLLATSKERFSLALSGADLGLWDWDLETGEMIFNHRFAQMLGYRLHDLANIFSQLKYLIYHHDRDLFIEKLSSHLDDRTEKFESEHRMVHGNGEILWVFSKGKITARNKFSKALRITTTVLDISDRKRMEEEQEKIRIQLFNNSKLISLGNMTAGMAHEINNPLTIIKGNTLVLKKRLEKNGILDKYSLQINKQLASCDRIAEIINGLRYYTASSTGSSGASNISKKCDSERPESMGGFVDVHKIIFECLENMREVLEREKIVIKINLMAQEFNLKSSADKVHLVVNSILKNAVSAIIDGNRKCGSITIEDYNVSQSILIIKIIDDGIGIAASALNHIFDPFFTTRPPGSGIGLGLFNSQAIIASLGGTIEVESRSGDENCGSSFNIRVPASAVVADTDATISKKIA